MEGTGEDGRLHLQVVTLHTVSAGTQLFLNHALTIDESEAPADYSCRCELLGCRRIMAAV
jgi:hypothetical protein